MQEGVRTHRQGGRMKNEDLYVYKKSDFYEDFISSQKEYYDREQVDTLLSEKDKEIALLKERICNGDVSRLTWIDDCIAKDKEIAELKAKLEDVQASAYAESVDAGMRDRRMKRALWLARAERAVAEQTVDEWSRYKEKHPFGSWRADPFEYWMQAWICVEKICRKKAEEYK